MIRLRVKLNDPKPGRPALHATLPTYNLISHDEEKKVAVVEIPAFAHPFTPEEVAAMPEVKDDKHGPFHDLSDEHLKKLHTHFDSTYQEHKGKFRVEKV